MEKPVRTVFCKVCGKTGPAWQFAPVLNDEGHLCEEHSVESNRRRRLNLTVVSSGKEIPITLAESRAKVRRK